MQPPSPQKPQRVPLSSAERKQIRDLVRFLATVLFFVIAASLVMAVVVNLLQ